MTSHDRIRQLASAVGLAILLAALVVPAALAGGIIDGRSPDVRDAAAQARLATQPDARPPDTIDASDAARARALAPSDGRSPDTLDATVQAHAPVVTLVRSRGFAWLEFGIGITAALAVMSLFAGLAVLATRQSHGPRIGSANA